VATENNAYYCRQAIDLKLVRNSTEFWTKVKASELTAREWVRIASSGQPQEERYPELDGTPFSDEIMAQAKKSEKYDNLDQPGWSRESPRHNYGTVRITTAHISHKPTSDELVINVTVKSGLQMFAPTWRMVEGYLGGAMSKEQYTKLYLKMMEESWTKHQHRWETIITKAALEGRVIVLTCYCRKGAFCHRHLLKKILAEKAESLSYHAIILPEK
jgi:hypothetical protein